MLLPFIIPHRCGHVIALLKLSCQPPPAFVASVAGCLLLLSNASNLKGSTSRGGVRGTYRRACQISFIVGHSHRQPPPAFAMLGNCWLLRPLLSRSSSSTTSS
jgi:hypothetical protein